MPKLQKVLIMAGGTGGHIFPGLAVANRLLEEGVKVNWLGTRKGLEAKMVPENQIPLSFISISGLRGKGWLDILLAPWKLTIAIWQAARILRQIKPDVVIGLGGFVSGPGGIACWLLRYPLIIHEQNAIPGTTNKWLAKIANKVLAGFPNTFPKKLNGLTIGNPIRREIIHVPEPSVRFPKSSQSLRLLVIGGSLGAAAINDLIPQALAKIPLNERPEVYHQTGEKHYAVTVEAYAEANVKAKLEPFIKNMAEAYSWADIVLCRSGASTISELCAVGLGAILIPFPYAIDDHQTANANFMVAQNAAWLIQQVDLTVEKLIELLQKLQQDREKCYLMAHSAFKSRKIDATEQVLKICQEICQ